MKWTLILSTLVLSLSVIASSPVIDEQLYVLGSPEQVRDLLNSGSVIIDHVEEDGFELYGPAGLGQFLAGEGIEFLAEENHNILDDYPSFENITSKLEELAERRPDIFKLFSIGKSVQGRDLWVMKISDNVQVDEVEPEFKYIASMHGDEIVGRELSMRLIEKIANEYDSNPLIQDIVNNTELFIMPSMNPDGSHLKRRSNANRIDLNRNFPDIFRDQQNSPNRREVETQAVMQFHESRKFSLSANLHGGTMVVNYPWDSSYTRHPFNDLLVDVSLSYAKLCKPMYESSQFSQGITNGADWYLVRGGMQDWSSFWFDDLQLTIEVSHKKWPAYRDIEGLWKGQEKSLINLMTKIHQGAGLRFEESLAQGKVKIEMISPISKEIGEFSFKGGEFYKVLETGFYSFKLENGNTYEMEVGPSIMANGNYRYIAR